MAMSAAAAYAATRKPQREQQQGQQGQQENQETQEQQKIVGEQPELQQLPPPLQTIAVNSMGGPVGNGQDGHSGGAGSGAGGSDDDTTKNANGGTRPAADTAAYTPTALSRWSVAKSKLPAVDTIRSLHVYDFDNTLFKTPLPNAKLWNAATMGYLASQDVLATGGWWHDARILAATGRGLAEEEPRAWAGWWNEHIVELVQLTASQPDALSVLLTGRAERAFADLIQRMAASRGLVFDLVVLKPAAGPNNERFASTMAFKQAFLATLMETYAAAGTIRLYEDRPRHVEGFREFFEAYNGNNNNNNSFEKRQTQCYPARRRPPIQGTVVPVAELATTLDPVVEVAEVQHMVRLHNAAVAAGGRPNQDGRAVTITPRHRRMAVRKTVFFTGYLLQETDTQRLLRLLHDHVPPHVVARRDLLKYHANNIMISPRACPPALLRKAGGLGRKFAWRVVALGHLDDHSVWAAKVQPADDQADAGEERVGYHTAEPVPLVVLAVWRNGRPHDASRIRAWRPLPPDEVFVMETKVGEKAMLRVEAESLAGAADENEQSLRGGKAPAKRKRFSGHGGHGGGGPYPSGPSNAPVGVGVGRGRPPFPHHNTGAVPTQPAAFAAGSGGRGYHNVPTAPRGGFRGAGFGRGAYRGGGSLRGRGGGPGV